uniref:Uncharacterized protein n=1 Tax=Callorhinchus milii TaxID=7868 RepID=A0A4W3I7X3_CALMI|eukprot:gi/632947367/ref/XP_007889013.1/ PREDICTED: protein FAM208B [Callorhinchus milii]
MDGGGWGWASLPLRGGEWAPALAREAAWRDGRAMAWAEAAWEEEEARRQRETWWREAGGWRRRRRKRRRRSGGTQAEPGYSSGDTPGEGSLPSSSAPEDGPDEEKERERARPSVVRVTDLLGRSLPYLSLSGPGHGLGGAPKPRVYRMASQMFRERQRADCTPRLRSECFGGTQQQQQQHHQQHQQQQQCWRKPSLVQEILDWEYMRFSQRLNSLVNRSTGILPSSCRNEGRRAPKGRTRGQKDPEGRGSPGRRAPPACPASNPGPGGGKGAETRRRRLCWRGDGDGDAGPRELEGTASSSRRHHHRHRRHHHHHHRAPGVSGHRQKRRRLASRASGEAVDPGGCPEYQGPARGPSRPPGDLPGGGGRKERAGCFPPGEGEAGGEDEGWAGRGLVAPAPTGTQDHDLHRNLNEAEMDDMWRGTYRYYVVETNTEQFFEELKNLLKKESHVEIGASDLSSIQLHPPEKCFVIIRKDDVWNHLHQIPHLTLLKRTRGVHFAGVDSPEDMEDHTFQELLCSGGFVVSDWAVLESATVEYLQRISDVLMELNEESEWKWMLHMKELKQLKEKVRDEDVATRKNSLLTSMMAAKVVEVLPFHECDSRLQEKPDYLNCLIKLQVQKIASRFAVFLTGKPEEHRDTFMQNGILVTDANSFVKDFNAWSTPSPSNSTTENGLS